MSPFASAAVVAILLGVAGACVVAGLRSSRRTVASVRDVLYGAPASPTRASRRPGVGALADGPLGEHVRRVFGSDLALIDATPHDIVTKVVLGGGACALAVVLSCGALIASGMLPASPWWALLALGAGGAGAMVMWGDTRSKIATKRRELDRAVNDFLQLVAVGLTTDQSVDEAVGFALSIGDGQMAEILRTEVQTAPLRGMAVWESLEQLGRRLDHPVLCELASSVERQGTHGVSITRTVSSLAAAQRSRALDELERDADRANANLSGPTVCFVVTTVVFLAYPLAMRIGEAFGG